MNVKLISTKYTGHIAEETSLTSPVEVIHLLAMYYMFDLTLNDRIIYVGIRKLYNDSVFHET